MPRCSNCGCDLPGLETLCQQCFEAGYDRLAQPKPWWRRFQLRPRFTRDNFIGSIFVFTLLFARLRFDFPYSHARHMWTTETSALFSAFFACIAFFYEGRAKSRAVVEASSSRTSTGYGRSTYARLLLLVVCEITAGTLLYGLFTVMPLALQALVTVASWTIVSIEVGTFPKNKSMGSFLGAVTGVASFSCGVAWGITGQEVWSRLMLVGGCLMAALIFLDRRQEWLDHI